MGEIKFNIGQGGLGRALAGKDYYSAMHFDSATYPAGFSATEPIKQVGSLQEAEQLGIVDTGLGETAATGGAIQVTAVGATGDSWLVTISSANGTPIELASVIEAAAETADSLATKIADAINAGFNTHGFSATSATDTVNLVVAANWGAAFNAAGLVATSSGAGTVTVTQFSGGVGSELAVMHYQISEFFRLEPKGLLWIGIWDESTGLDSQHIEDLFTFSNNDIRNYSLSMRSTWASSDMATLQTAIEFFQTDNTGMQAIYGADLSATTITALDDLRGLTYDRVSAVLGMDGGAEGWRLFDVMGRSVPCLGAVLGTMAAAQVHINIGWVQAFNLAAVELDVLAFATGDLYSTISKNTIKSLSTKGWLFAREITGKAGTYFDDSPTAAPVTSDYAYIENGRTIDKAVRGVNTALADYINAPLYVAEDGTLQELTISTFKDAAENPLEQMLIDGELSAYEVVIDPAQNVLSTSKLVVTVRLVPVGVSRFIEVNIGFYPNLTT